MPALFQEWVRLSISLQLHDVEASNETSGPGYILESRFPTAFLKACCNPLVDFVFVTFIKPVSEKKLL